MKRAELLRSQGRGEQGHVHKQVSKRECEKEGNRTEGERETNRGIQRARGIKYRKTDPLLSIQKGKSVSACYKIVTFVREVANIEKLTCICFNWPVVAEKFWGPE